MQTTELIPTRARRVEEHLNNFLAELVSEELSRSDVSLTSLSQHLALPRETFRTKLGRGQLTTPQLFAIADVLGCDALVWLAKAHAHLKEVAA